MSQTVSTPDVDPRDQASQDFFASLTSQRERASNEAAQAHAANVGLVRQITALGGLVNQQNATIADLQAQLAAATKPASKVVQPVANPNDEPRPVLDSSALPG